MKLAPCVLALVMSAAADAQPLPADATELGNYYVRQHDRILLKRKVQTLFDSEGRLDVFERGRWRLTPLHKVDALRFKLLDDSYATDGRYVWCGGTDPIATAAEVTPLGRGFFVVGKAIQRGCRNVVVHDNGAVRPLTPESFTLLSCGIVRSQSRLYSSGRTELSQIAVKDPSTFVVNDQCSASDSRASYRFDHDGTMLAILPLPGKGMASNGYSIVEGVVYSGASPLEEADAASFLTFSAACTLRYAIDARHAYFDERVIQGADPTTFSCIEGSSYARDSHFVYLGDRPLPEIDRSTFEVLAVLGCRPVFSKDARHVYYNLVSLEGADPGTFRVSSGTNRLECWGVGHDAQHVYWNRQILAGADAGTFKLMSDGFAYDKKSAYRFGKPLRQEDKQEFDRMRLQEALVTAVASNGYATLDGVVYFGTSPLQQADTPTFRTLSPACHPGAYAVDARHVYLSGRVIEGADPATFSCIEGTGLSRDVQRVYLGAEPIKGIDGATFEMLSVRGCPNIFTRDAHRVYYKLRPLEQVDPRTFEMLSGMEPGECWDVGRDAHHVVWSGRILAGADAATFKLLHHGFAYDKEHAYRFGASLTARDQQEYDWLRIREAALKR